MKKFSLFIFVILFFLFAAGTNVRAGIEPSPRTKAIKALEKFALNNGFCLTVESQDNDAFIQVYEKEEGPVIKIAALFDLRSDILVVLEIFGRKGEAEDKLVQFSDKACGEIGKSVRILRYKLIAGQMQEME